MSLASRKETEFTDDPFPSRARVEPFFLVNDDTITLSKHQLFFANLNLDGQEIEAMLLPVMDLLGQRIAFTYKSPAKITYQGTSGIYQRKLSDWLQFDDVLVKFLHVATNANVMISLSTQIVRTMPIRLLSTTLVDDTHGVLFSTTEKGIFSFMIARLLLDLKHSLGNAMPDLKLMGIYHCLDESIHNTSMSDYGVFNFSCAFAHQNYPVSVAMPATIFNLIKPSQKEIDGINRCGHIARSMIFAVAKLSMTQKVLSTISFGDLIIFDRAQLGFHQGRLSGSLKGIWHGIAIDGTLAHVENRYGFSPIV